MTVVAVSMVERAAVRLTQPHTEMTEAGAVDWPPLLLWLERSVTEVVKRGGAGSNGLGIPINFGALRVLDDIRRAASFIRETLFLERKRGNAKLVEDVAEAWVAARDARSRGQLDDGQWLSLCEELVSWVRRIEAEQELRPRQMELTVACPRCGVRWVLMGGERRAAVVIEYAEGRDPVAQCRSEVCDAFWSGWGEVAKLGLSVQASVDEGVLASCGIHAEQGGVRARDAMN